MRFRYPHQAALDRAVVREDEAARTFAQARDCSASASQVCSDLAACDDAIRCATTLQLHSWDGAVGLSRAVSRDTATSMPLTLRLAASDGALIALGSRRLQASARLQVLASHAAAARAAFEKRGAERDALSRHRARATARHALESERREEAACEESAALASQACRRSSGTSGS